MEDKSLDPRVNRLDVKKKADGYQTNSQWPTYEVFHQAKKGKQPMHVGIVHAPNHQMALVFAKEQYGRRQTTTDLWVVKTSDVYTLGHELEDIFDTTPEKTFREPADYKVRDRIEKYKAEHGVK